MADFCKQCSIEHFGKDFKELARPDYAPKLTDEDKEQGMGWAVLCEGCGFIIVDDDGKCIDPKCEKHGKEKA